MEISDDGVPDVNGQFSGYGDPNPDTRINLSRLGGVDNNNNNNTHQYDSPAIMDVSEHELEGLSEILPDVKARKIAGRNHPELPGGMTADNVAMPTDGNNNNIQSSPMLSIDEGSTTMALDAQSSDFIRGLGGGNKNNNIASGVARRSTNLSTKMYDTGSSDGQDQQQPSGDVARRQTQDNNESGDDDGDSTLDGYPDESGALDDNNSRGGDSVGNDRPVPKEFMNPISSMQSISTATQTHEVHMPMYLPTFKPATGCTNASDFIVRCFVARLRSGITVVKHGRSRWCKSRLRVLHIHSDGRSLSWKPAEGEPNTNKRPPKLDLSTCLEVRHAWSPDPQNPMYTGTPILRQKCEAANAHKSFALIFKHRTVDITAVTADHCKVLMEGFSALCFRLQVANLASRGSGAKNKPPHARPMPEEDGISTTASATLTNSSTPRGR